MKLTNKSWHDFHWLSQESMNSFISKMSCLMQSSHEVSFNTSFLVLDLNKAYQLFVISVRNGVITDYGVCHSTPLLLSTNSFTQLCTLLLIIIQIVCLLPALKSLQKGSFFYHNSWAPDERCKLQCAHTSTLRVPRLENEEPGRPDCRLPPSLPFHHVPSCQKEKS